jgi:glutathionyl-hydroquinone reductase
MGMLVNGVWHQEDPPTAAADGSFVRLQSGFRDRVTQDGAAGSRPKPGATCWSPHLPVRGRTAPC